MDIFRLLGSNWTSGKIVNGIEKATWVERFREAGEFTIEGKLSADLRSQLPIGSVISHVKTLQVMLVENHEISEKLGEETYVKITGRSFETFLENRLAAANSFPLNNPVTNAPFSYDFAAGSSWVQARQLIREHTVASAQILNTMDNLPNFEVRFENTSSSDSTQIARVVKRGNVYQRVLEILEYSDLGIKTLRPYSSANLEMVIHGGLFKGNTVTFSYATGDILSADYLWSNKKKKNAALVLGKYDTRVIRPVGLTGLDVRMGLIDATDFEEKPAGDGSNFTYIDQVLGGRGQDILRGQKDVAITRADISRTSKFKYRTDYDIGDRVWVVGNYGATEQMRVTEYVEISDNEGETGYPTLSLVTS